MPKFKIKFSWEAIVEAADEDEAELVYYQGLERDNETINNIAADSMTVGQIKKCEMLDCKNETDGTYAKCAECRYKLHPYKD